MLNLRIIELILMQSAWEISPRKYIFLSGPRKGQSFSNEDNLKIEFHGYRTYVGTNEFAPYEIEENNGGYRFPNFSVVPKELTIIRVNSSKAYVWFDNNLVRVYASSSRRGRCLLDKDRKKIMNPMNFIFIENLRGEIFVVKKNLQMEAVILHTLTKSNKDIPAPTDEFMPAPEGMPYHEASVFYEKKCADIQTPDLAPLDHPAAHAQPAHDELILTRPHPGMIPPKKCIYLSGPDKGKALNAQEIERVSLNGSRPFLGAYQVAFFELKENDGAYCFMNYSKVPEELKIIQLISYNKLYAWFDGNLVRVYAHNTIRGWALLSDNQKIQNPKQFIFTEGPLGPLTPATEAKNVFVLLDKYGLGRVKFFDVSKSDTNAPTDNFLHVPEGIGYHIVSAHYERQIQAAPTRDPLTIVLKPFDPIALALAPPAPAALAPAALAPAAPAPAAPAPAAPALAAAAEPAHALVDIDLMEDILPCGGVSRKYAGDIVSAARLPETWADGPLIKKAPDSVGLNLSRLSDRGYSIERQHRLRFSLLGDGFDVKFSLFTTIKPAEGEGPIPQHTTPIFVFCGRGMDAYIPKEFKQIEDPEENLRIILVGTRAQYKELQYHLGDGVDFLAVERLVSKTHGDYADKLGLINTRRLAAMIFAMKLGVPYAFFFDDNIENVRFQSAGAAKSTWTDFCNRAILALQQMGTACASIPTETARGLRKEKPGELGSKLFIFNLSKIVEILGPEISNLWFIPFLSSSSCNLWGEDYYFQLLLAAMFSRVSSGFRILPSDQWGITRTPQPPICVKTVKTATVWEKEPEILFNEMFPSGLEHLNELNPNASTWVNWAIKELHRIVLENRLAREEHIRRAAEASLMSAHAQANNVAPYKPDPTFSPLPDEAFLYSLTTQIQVILSQGILLDYQNRLLEQVLENLTREDGTPKFDSQGNATFNFEMATGTGKTYIQIALAIAALLTKNPRPVVIVTPYQQLVEQFFRDFITILQRNPQLGIQPAQVLKIDGRVSSISVETLKQNPSLKEALASGACFVAIACTDSYEKILTFDSEQFGYLNDPCMVMLDESHLQKETVETLSKNPYLQKNSFVAGLSATPSTKPSMFTSADCTKISYTRMEAVDNNNLAPCILDTLNVGYSLENVNTVLEQLDKLVKETHLPGGGVLADKKGIIYLPNDKDGYSYSSEAVQKLTDAGIPCVEINADQPDVGKKLKGFRESGNIIAICKSMIKEGFSDVKINWVLNLRNDNASDVCQSAGRCMRKDPENLEKVAYVVGFNDIKSERIFPKGQQTKADPAALERCTEEYQAQKLDREGHAFLLNPPMVLDDDDDDDDDEDLSQPMMLCAKRPNGQTYLDEFGIFSRKRRRESDIYADIRAEISSLADGLDRLPKSSRFGFLSTPSDMNNRIKKINELAEKLLQLEINDEVQELCRTLLDTVIRPLLGTNDSLSETESRLEVYINGPEQATNYAA